MSEPHTSVTPGAQELLATILQCMEQYDAVPSQAELADMLGVTKRTIQRWMAQLAEAHQISKFGRRYFKYRAVAMDRHGSPWIANVSGSMAIHDDPKRSMATCPHCGAQSPKPVHGDPKRSGGGGVHDHADHGSTKRPRARANGCATELGRFLAANHIGAAREFDQAAARGEIDEATYLAWFVEELGRGTPAQRAVYLARLGAPTGQRVDVRPGGGALDPSDLASRYPGLIRSGSDLTGYDVGELDI